MSPLLTLLLMLGAQADPVPRVKTELSPKDGIWVGQRVTFAVTLYTPDLFAGVPSFEIPSISGVVVVPPIGSPVIGSESIGEDMFTTQRHEFSLYSQRPGVVRIPAFRIQFESNAGFGKPTVQRLVTTEEASYTAKSPFGAEGLGTVIAARDLKVTDRWEPEPKSPKLGDAITQTLSITAADVPGMVFPPLRVDAIDGLAAYPKPPVVDDRTDRGSLTGKRVETITYVFEKPGAFTIPDRTLTWFDLDAKELKTVRLPGRTFSVSAESTTPSEQPDVPGLVRSRMGLGWILAATVALSAFLWLLLSLVWHRLKQALAAHAESEAAYFTRLRRACRDADVHAVYVALLAWLNRFGPMTIDQFTTRAGDPELTREIDALRNRVYTRTDPTVTWSPRHMLDRIEHACRSCNSSTRHPDVCRLPPLNPV